MCQSPVWNFNPRSRKGNDKFAPRGCPPWLLFQSTFPQGERPKEVAKKLGFTEISIHVPARGTTAITADELIDVQISIHVPARGTTIPRLVTAARRRFQSTFPQGERLMIGKKSTIRSNFNPRSRKGNDSLNAFLNPVKVEFQSTFPQGERRAYNLEGPSKSIFQSTFPQGERHDSP